MRNFPKVSPQTNTACNGAEVKTGRETLWRMTPEYARLCWDCEVLYRPRLTGAAFPPIKGGWQQPSFGGAVGSSCELSNASLAATGAAVHLPAEYEATGGCKNEFDGKRVPRSATPLMSRTNLLCPSTLCFQGQFVFVQIAHTVRKKIYIYKAHGWKWVVGAVALQKEGCGFAGGVCMFYWASYWVVTLITEEAIDRQTDKSIER